MFKALWLSMLVFIPFGACTVLVFLLLKLPVIYQALQSRGTTSFLVISSTGIALTGLYLHTLNRMLLQRIEAFAHWHTMSRWAAVVGLGGAAAVVVCIAFATTILLIAWLTMGKARWS